MKNNLKSMRSFAATLITFGSLAGGANGAVLINFSDSPVGTLTAGTIITTQYLSLGVTFSATENGSPINLVVVDIETVAAQGNYLGNTDSNSFGSRHDTITITFSSPVENVSWLTQSHGGQSISFNAFSSSNTLLQTVNTSSGGISWGTTSFSASGISRIEANQPSDGWAWGLDNLSYTVVPEPASASLIVLGGLGILARRRRIK